LNAGIDFLEFRPSEIAASVAISVSRQMQAEAIDKALSCLIQVEKVKLVVPTEIKPGQDKQICF
jgi:cyclin D1/2/4